MGGLPDLAHDYRWCWSHLTLGTSRLPGATLRTGGGLPAGVDHTRPTFPTRATFWCLCRFLVPICCRLISITYRTLLPFTPVVCIGLRCADPQLLLPPYGLLHSQLITLRCTVVNCLVYPVHLDLYDSSPPPEPEGGGHPAPHTSRITQDTLPGAACWSWCPHYRIHSICDPPFCSTHAHVPFSPLNTPGPHSPLYLVPVGLPLLPPLPDLILVIPCCW